MKEFFDCLFTNNGLAYATGVIIFLITLILTANRWIGFTLTLLLLLIALAASFGVANKESIRNYFNGLGKEKAVSGTYQSEGTKLPEPTLSDKVEKAFEDLKIEFEVYKKKMQDYFEEQKKATPPSPPENQPSQK
jgi:hypothetical protein